MHNWTEWQCAWKQGSTGIQGQPSTTTNINK